MSLVLTEILAENNISAPATDSLPKPADNFRHAKLTQYNRKNEKGVKIPDEWGVIQYSTMLSHTQSLFGLSCTAQSWLTGPTQQSKKVFSISLGESFDTELLVKALKSSSENMYIYLDVSEPDAPVTYTVAEYREMQKTGVVKDNSSKEEKSDDSPSITPSVATPVENAEYPM